MKFISSRSTHIVFVAVPLVLSMVLVGCVPGSPTAAIDEDTPDFIDPLPSSTPTWALPDPDDEDPVADCSLETPICQVGVGIEKIAGATYLGVDLRVVPIPGKWQPGETKTFFLTGEIDLLHEGKAEGPIKLGERSVGFAAPERGFILTQEDGAPLLHIDSSELGVLLADPRPSPSLAAAYDPSTQELLLLDAEGNPIATISAGGIGVLLADPRPSPSYHFSSDPTAGGFLILNAEEEPLVSVDPSNATVWFLDPMGDRVAGLVMLNELVVIAAPQGGPVAIVHPGPGGGDGDYVWITRLIPLSLDLQGEFDLSGSLELLAVDEYGERTVLGRSGIDEKGQTVSIRKVPDLTPTATSVGGKWTPTAPPMRASATPAPHKPTATSKPPDPTAKPTDDGGKPTPTPGK